MKYLNPYLLTISSILMGCSANALGADGDLNVTGNITAGALSSAAAFANPVCHDVNGKFGNCAPMKPAKMARVAVSGGDYTSPLDAVTNLANWCGTPSATNRCLIKIFPGIYDLGTNSLSLQYDFLDLTGSGSNVTLIKGQMSNFSTPLISITGNSHIRNLRIENISPTGNSLVAIVDNGAQPLFSHVVLYSDSGTYDISVALHVANGSHPRLTDAYLYAKGNAGTVAASVTGASIDIYGSRLEARETAGTSGGNHDAIHLTNSNLAAYRSEFLSDMFGVSASENTTGQQYSITVEHSVISVPTTNAAAFSGSTNEETALSVAFADSKLIGRIDPIGSPPPVYQPIYPVCVGNYDGNFYALSTSCQ
jgi:hypothetical protein